MKRFAILFLCLAGLLAPTRADAQLQSRRVFVLWDSSVTTRWRETFAHLMLEMPLNRLGYVVEPVDVAKPMPSTSSFEGAHAVVSWLEADTVPDARAAFGFIEAATARGLRFVQLGDAAFLRGRDGAPSVSIAEGNRVFARAGFRLVDDFVRLTFDVEVLRKESALVEYERPLDRVLPPYPVWRPLDARTRSLLVLRRRGQPDTESHVVMLAPGGGLASFGYSHFFEPELRRRQWRIDPFEFLAAALGAGGGPVPDVTTLAGRRIFFSHVDGDGWRNVTEIVPWRRSRKLSSEVILDEVLKRYPELPVTIGPVVADLHPDWCGSDETRAIARQMFALQHVEAGSHTWTHPLDWGFFDVPDTAAKERPFLRRYPGCRSEPSRLVAIYERIMRRLAGAAGDGDDGSEFDGQYGTIGSYNTPRSFAKTPFDIGFEIEAAAAYIATLAPAGKTVPVVQWSGNTMPFEAVLRATRVAGLRNINGGDTRYDREYNSVSYVSPIGRRVGQERQIYSAASNENTYTDLWTDRFFGYRALVETFERTESPRRLVPINLYYHIYTGEKEPSLKALLDNIEYIRARDVAPIFTSHYAAIAEGFYDTRVEKLGPNVWRIGSRGALQTLRFDPPLDAMKVDFSRSIGVLGYRRDAGALYVALDPSVSEPVVAVSENADPRRPSLFDSRWPVRGLQVNAEGFMFEAAGFGRGTMRWRVEPAARYRISEDSSAGRDVVADETGILAFALDATPGSTVSVHVAGPLR
jgi:polysaccharide biosynthesis protein PelA